MTNLRKGLIVAIAQMGLVASLGGKLLVDRARLPRVWIRTVPVDPSLPVRGRYVRLSAVVAAAQGARFEQYCVYSHLRAEEGRLVAVPTHRGDGECVMTQELPQGTFLVLQDPIAFFIPEHAPDPSRRASGEELWVEATVPRKGPPRPIRLGVKKGGILVPLALE
jgi:hypothetical protein